MRAVQFAYKQNSDRLCAAYIRAVIQHNFIGKCIYRMDRKSKLLTTDLQWRSYA